MFYFWIFPFSFSESSPSWNKKVSLFNFHLDRLFYVMFYVSAVHLHSPHTHTQHIHTPNFALFMRSTKVYCFDGLWHKILTLQNSLENNVDNLLVDNLGLVVL